MSLKRVVEVLGWLAIVYLIYVGLSAILRRYGFMMAVREIPSANASEALDPFNLRYYEHPVTVFLHLLPGLLFMILGPLQFIRKIRSRFLGFHRWSGRVFLTATVIGASSGFVIGVLYPFGGYEGGFNEAMATLFFSIAVLWCAVMALVRIKQRKVALHREWMIRTFALGLAVATERVMLDNLQQHTGVPFIEVFGTTFWMAGICNLVAAELWIHWTRPIGASAKVMGRAQEAS